MDLTDAEEHEVLDAVFTFIDDWDERSTKNSEPPRNEVQLTDSQPWLSLFVEEGCNKRGKPRRELPKQELLRLRQEVPALESRLKTLQAVRTRYGAANCEASRVIALAVSELRGRPEAQLFLVWREMAKKHEELRKKAEEENRILREHIAYQLRTIESLQKLKSTSHPRQISLRLLLPRSNTIENTTTQSTLVSLCGFLANQLSDTDQVFRFGNMPSTLSEVSSDMVSSTQMHLEVLHSNYLPFHFQAVAVALWRNCRNCQRRTDIDPVHEDTLASSFVSSYESNELSFATTGHSTMRMYDDSMRNIIVSSSKYQLVMLQNDPGAYYSEKAWVVIEPAHEGATELCTLRVCARIELTVDDHLSDRERHMDLLSEFLLEQKRQELDAIRLGIEDDLLTAPSWQVSL